MNNRLIVILLAFLFIASCQSKPKVVEGRQKMEMNVSPEMATNQTLQPHTVLVNEVMQATKYTYAHVTEEGKSYWVALPKSDIKAGETYQYADGFKKTNFVSRDFNRTFDEIWLVNGFTKDGQTTNRIDKEEAHAAVSGESTSIQSGEVEGGVSLADLFENKDAYAGKKITVSGKVVKVNNAIMDRNWVHIQDGSTDKAGNNYDLTITTDAMLMVGTNVTLEGIITLDKDFGAGYQYDVIMEKASRK